MAARWYFAWRLASEAIEADRREEKERRRLLKRRKLFTPSHIADRDFLNRYRLTKEAFYFLCDTLRENTNLKNSQRASLESKVLTALHFYANGDHQRQVVIPALYFSQEATSGFINQVTKALNHPNVVKRVIKFPSTPEARREINVNYYKQCEFPGVIGSVDGCHFRILKPKKEEGQLYCCKENYYSLNVQMVADEKCKILAINAKYGGASSDAFVWENSQLNTYMQSLHQNGESMWLLGDTGYPQRPWLMTPYKYVSPGTVEESYNNSHSRGCATVENAIKLLKNRWRCVSNNKVLHYKPEKCSQIIVACSVLHNIALDFRVPDPEDQIIDSEEFQRNEYVQHGDLMLWTQGCQLRDKIARRLHTV